MSLPPLDEFMAIDPNSYLQSVPGWGAELKALASDFAEYKAGVYAPGGADWWGKTATAAQDKAGEDSKAVSSIHDTVDSLVSEVTASVTYGVVPPLTNGHNIVDKARKTEGVTVNQDYTMTYSAPDGMSKEQADKNKQTVAAAATELKESANKWFSASQGVADQIHTAESKITGAINLSAVGANGRTAVRSAVAATNPAAFAPTEVQKLLSGDPASTKPAGVGGMTDTLDRLPQTQDQPGVPLKDKLGKPEVPIPDQQLYKKDKELGTQIGKGVDKGSRGHQYDTHGYDEGRKVGGADQDRSRQRPHSLEGRRWRARRPGKPLGAQGRIQRHSHQMGSAIRPAWMGCWRICRGEEGQYRTQGACRGLPDRQQRQCVRRSRRQRQGPRPDWWPTRRRGIRK